jgi:hypothetical protein
MDDQDDVSIEKLRVDPAQMQHIILEQQSSGKTKR